MPRIEAEEICLIRLSSLGDTVHALSLANGLRRGYPDARITWILEPVPCEMVRYQPAVNQFVVFDKRSGLKAFRRLRNDLAAQRFDLLLVPQVSFRSSFAAAMVRAGVKLGFDRRRAREMHSLFTNRHIPPRPIRHAQDQMFEFLEYLEIPNDSPEWGFVFTDEELIWRQEFFGRFEQPAISFVVNTSNQLKNWTAERFAKVMDGVSKRGFQSLIVGGTSLREHNISDRIKSLCSAPVHIGLEPSIRKTMLQLSGSQAVVSLDTGPLHAAVAMNIPTIGLYGYSDPRRCGPYRKYRDLLVDTFTLTGEESDPVSRRTKPGRMSLITPEEVLQKIDLALAHYPAHQNDWNMQ